MIKSGYIFMVAILSLMISMSVAGQSIPGYDDDLSSLDDTSGTNILYRKQMGGGVVLHNLGMGVQFRKGKNKTFFVSRFWEIELVSMKHPKQVRVINPYYFNAKSYVYGKLNHVYMLRGGYGSHRMLNRKPYWGGIELRAIYMAGASLALAKPVYLYFWDDTYTILKEERYDPENPFHSSEFIYGRAPFLSGFSEIKVYPGLFAKAGLNFEFGSDHSKMRSLEAGAVVEYYPVSIPIMAFNAPQNIFFTFYIAFQLGRRYN